MEKVELHCPCGATLKKESNYYTELTIAQTEFLAFHKGHGIPPVVSIEPPPVRTIVLWGKPVRGRSSFKGFSSNG